MAHSDTKGVCVYMCVYVYVCVYVCVYMCVYVYARPSKAVRLVRAKNFEKVSEGRPSSIIINVYLCIVKF